MLYLEKQVIRHPSCKIVLAAANQTQDDKITVPSIHFIKTAAWNHIWVGKV